MIKHFIYDFDGTLSDSYPQFLRIVHEIARRNGATTTVNDAALHRALKDRTHFAIPLFQWKEELTYEEYVKQFQELQIEYAADFQLYPGALELLEAVIQSGGKNYLYTHSGKPVYKILDHMGIARYFTYILDSSQGFPSKPAPDALLSLCERFSIDPTEAIMIGDRPIDVQAGENAGMHSCLFDPDGYFQSTSATYRVDRLCDIFGLVGDK